MTPETPALEERDLGPVTLRFSNAITLGQAAIILRRAFSAVRAEGVERAMRLRLGVDSLTLIGPASLESALVRLVLARDLANELDDVVAPIVRRNRGLPSAPPARAHVRIGVMTQNVIPSPLHAYVASAWEDAIIDIEILDELAVLWTTPDAELLAAMRARPDGMLIERWREPWVQVGETAATG